LIAIKKEKIINAKIITPYSIIEKGSVLINGGMIEAVLPYNPSTEDYAETDAKGCYVAPGLFDIHVHGSGGYDCMDNTEEAFLGLARCELVHGATTVIPTSISCSHEKLKEFIRVFEKVRSKNHDGADMPGLHLEGPYISMEQKGAMEPQYVRGFNEKEYNEILEMTDSIMRWSAAPELEGAKEFAKAVTGRGILCAFAHSDAVCAVAEQAVDWGFSHATHLYSGMSTLKRVAGIRTAGLVEAAYLSDEVTIELISDGMHLPPELLRLAYKIKGPDKTVLITDAMRAAGLGEGSYSFGDREVIVKDGVAWADAENFSGSIATPDVCIRVMTKKAGIPLLDAVKMMTLTPARLCGLDNKKGSLEAGKDADLIMFDEDISIQRVYKKGEERKS
jgi:N-acetylglucosamine-6-phosphate deacetylase